jgi:putative FmdB family regulatory protein
MPIYAYKCDACGFAKDVLQKISDAPLTDCPQCAGVSFKKQLTAAGFQLKGSGWYATDFKGSGSAAGSTSGNAEPASTASETAAVKPVPESPAASCGTGCACH